MSRTKISGWGLLVILAALPAVLWMGGGAAPGEHPEADVAMSSVLPNLGGDFADGSAGSAAGSTGLGATPGPAPGVPADPDLLLLRDWLAGSFSSGAQSRADSSYPDTRLHVVPIWPCRADGYWLYVEQAVASRLDKPDRIRVYKISQIGDDLFESRVYKLPTETRFAGSWNKPNPLGTVTPDSLLPWSGSSIVLRKTRDGVFMGSTLGHDGESDLKGASYATSEIRIEPGRMLSWDRRFDAAGKQAWGAEKGPYELIRQPE